MKKTTLLAALAASAVLALAAQSSMPQSAGTYAFGAAKALGANAEVVNIVLHDGDLGYDVPVDRVLVIEHFIWALEQDSTHQSVNIQPAVDPLGVGDLLLKFSLTTPDSWTPSVPIRVLGGGTARVSILNNGVADWRDVMIVGRLVDA